MKQCIQCLETKPLTSFHKNKLGRDGYVIRCNTCTAFNRIQRLNGIYMSEEDRLELIKQARSKGLETDRKRSNELLTDIGYDIQSELSVYEQFLIKHNLVI